MSLLFPVSRSRVVGRVVPLLSAIAVLSTVGGGVAAAQSSSTAPTSTAPSSASTSASVSSSSPSATTGSTTSTSGAVVPTSGTSSAAPAECPKLMIYGMQGTGQSSPDASESQDTGALGTILGPVVDAFAGQNIIDRKYVPYEASFGGAPGTGSGKTEYRRSVSGGADKLGEMITADSTRCPDMLIGILGYSQGAGGASNVAKAIGDGSGPVPADKLAMGSMLSNPGRAPGSPVLPGAEGQEHPSAPPGAEGDEVEKVSVGSAQQQVPAGGGLGAAVIDEASDYGEASGRVASWCETGDMACDVPEGAPIARVMANLAGQSEINPDDPVGSLMSVADALATTTIKSGTDIVNEDISGDSITNLSYEPDKTISQRLEKASDPRTEAGDPGAALQKLGTIGLNSAVAVAKEVITPANIAELATIGFASPEAAIGSFVAKLGAAVVKLGAPTATKLSGQIMQTVEQEVEVNSELPKMVADVNYWQTAQRHGSYFNTPATPEGQSAADVTKAWLMALATDLGGEAKNSGATATSTGSSTSTSVPAGSSQVQTFAPSTAVTSSVLTVKPSSAAPSTQVGQ